MEADWAATAAEERGSHANDLASTEWVKGAMPAVKGLGMLNLVKEVNNKTKHSTGEKTKTYLGSKKVIKSTLNENDEESKRAKEASATVEAAK